MAKQIQVHKYFKAGVPAGRMSEINVPNPERTAYRIQSGIAGDYVFQEWPSRGAMLTTIEMQGKREPRAGDWRDFSKSRWAKAEASA